jgi:hypothetical protein
MRLDDETRRHSRVASAAPVPRVASTHFSQVWGSATVTVFGSGVAVAAIAFMGGRGDGG